MQRVSHYGSVECKIKSFDYISAYYLRLHQADESNENDPYVCFRRRDSKPIRKTRTAQNAISERMIRLKGELGQSYNLALAILQREQFKQTQSRNVILLWKARCKTLELKRKNGWQTTREEEDLLIDKERPAKKPRTSEVM